MQFPLSNLVLNWVVYCELRMGWFWQRNTVWEAGWLEYECFMRKKEVTLNSCQWCFFHSLVNALYIVFCFTWQFSMCLLNKTYSHLHLLNCVNMKAENSGVAGLFLSKPISVCQSKLPFTTQIWSCHDLWKTAGGLHCLQGKRWVSTVAWKVLCGRLLDCLFSLQECTRSSWLLHPVRFFQASLSSYRLFPWFGVVGPPFLHLKNTHLSFKTLLSKIPCTVKPSMTTCAVTGLYLSL